MKVFLSKEFMSRLDDLHAYILEDSRSMNVADDVIDSILNNISILGVFPQAGKALVREDGTEAGTMYIVFDPYIMTYEIMDNTVFVSNIIDTRTKEWAELQGKYVSEHD